jgi:hypothetical protein
MPTLFSDFTLDASGDLDFSGNGMNLIESNQVSLRQRLYIRFNVWTGDWYFDESFGFPYRTFISKKTMKAVLDNRIKSTVRLEPDVISIVDFRSVMTVTSRSYECYFTVTTREGEEINLAFLGADTYEYPTPPDGNITLCGDDNQFITWQNRLYYLINFRLPIYGDATWYNVWAGQEPLGYRKKALGANGSDKGISTQKNELIRTGG